MKQKPNLTARVLSRTFFLESLPEELKVLAARNNAAQCRREIDDCIKKILKQGTVATWPLDDLGKAAFLLWLIKNPKAYSGRFVHARDRNKTGPATWALKSVLLDRTIRRSAK